MFKSLFGDTAKSCQNQRKSTRGRKPLSKDKKF